MNKIFELNDKEIVTISGGMGTDGKTPVSVLVKEAIAVAKNGFQDLAGKGLAGVHAIPSKYYWIGAGIMAVGATLVACREKIANAVYNIYNTNHFKVSVEYNHDCSNSTGK